MAMAAAQSLSGSPSLPKTSPSPSCTHSSTSLSTLVQQSPRLSFNPTGLAPSSPSLTSAEASSSYAHSSQSPQPSRSGLHPPSTPRNSLFVPSHVFTVPLRSLQERPFHQKNSSLPLEPPLKPQSAHSKSASFGQLIQSPTTRPPDRPLTSSSSRKISSTRIVRALERTFSTPSPQVSDESTRPTAQTRSFTAPVDSSLLLPRPSTASSAAPTFTSSLEGYCDPKPFARKSACESGTATPTLKFTEDIDEFNSRLSHALSDELSRISFREEAPDFDDMNLARSFTKRLGRPESVDGSHSKSSRPQISMPMGLISTTNQWVHEVPNITDLHVKEVQQRQISSSSSGSSFEGSDSGTSPTSEPPSMTEDTSSVESFSPVEPGLSPVEPNHLTPYFAISPPFKTESPAVAAVSPDPQKPLIAAPAVPRRAPSHSKREHERLARVRSVRSSTGSTEQLTSANQSQHNSLTAQTFENQTRSSLPPSTVEEEPQQLDPFSNELKQLDEVAEDFKPGTYESYSLEDAEDRRVMTNLGLKSYRVSEYLREIASFREGLWEILEEEEEEEEARLGWI